MLVAFCFFAVGSVWSRLCAFWKLSSID